MGTLMLPPAVPPALRSWRHFVTWQYEARANKATKVPYSPRTGRRAAADNPATWATLEEALRHCARPGHDGIGFMFSTGDPFCGVDLDHCRDPRTGALAPWAASIVRALGSYAEESPSTTGVH